MGLHKKKDRTVKSSENCSIGPSQLDDNNGRLKWLDT